ncbi:hypothetical protein [Paraburkholderia aromaticivorans]|uniref:hypothetical protein n=1 Tax=Paraburkholderia aromaticivorans TaxID=2026199 RepID=UPI001456129F|nr:hypothetical protein [Paraburkholderia aromaticivorans]
MEWQVGALTVEDEPILRIGGYVIYELASERETIILNNSDVPLRHVAIPDSTAYVFDFRNQQVKSNLGRARLYQRYLDASGNLKLVADPEA